MELLVTVAAQTMVLLVWSKWYCLLVVIYKDLVLFATIVPHTMVLLGSSSDFSMVLFVMVALWSKLLFFFFQENIPLNSLLTVKSMAGSVGSM